MLGRNSPLKYAIAAVLAAFAMAAKAQMVEDPVLVEKIDRAIDRGLAYLASVQNPDGSFPEGNGKTTAIPALAGMAFLAKGHVPGEGRYGDTINRCIDYIVSTAVTEEDCAKRKARGDKRYEPRGYLGAAAGGRMYAHSIATLFLSEISGMVDEERQKKIDPILEYAAKILLDAQAIQKTDNPARDTGGWRYHWDSTDSDMSASGWALMALRSSRQNGAPIPPSAIEKAVAYVKRHQDTRWGSFGYQNGSSNARTLTGAGILCLELCGKHNDPASLMAMKWIHEGRKYTQLPSDGNCFYGLYYTAQGLFQMGGEPWKEFADWMYRTWIPRQEANGSWNKGEQGSRPYQTAMCILAFAVPYRQLPIYQRDETVDEE